MPTPHRELALRIVMNNAAFDGDLARPEAARILRAAADQIERGDHCGKLFDTNGNQVAGWHANFDQED